MSTVPKIPTDDDEDPLSQYKYMLRQEGAYEESTQPGDFLGGSQHTDATLTPKRSYHRSTTANTNNNNKHKLGTPLPIQSYRPDDWLTPSKSPNRSWHPKSAPALKSGSVPRGMPTPPLMGDDDTVDNASQSTRNSSVGLGGNSSHHERRKAIKETGKPHTPRRWKGQRSTHSRSSNGDLDYGSSHSVGSFASESMAGTTIASTVTGGTNCDSNNKIVRKKFKNAVAPTTAAPVQPKRLPSLDADTVSSIHDKTLADILLGQHGTTAADMASIDKTDYEVASGDDGDDKLLKKAPEDKKEEHQYNHEVDGRSASPLATKFNETPFRTPQKLKKELRSTFSTPIKNGSNTPPTVSWHSKPMRTASTPPLTQTQSRGGVVSAPVTPSSGARPTIVADEEKISTKKFTAAFAAFENTAYSPPLRRYQSLQPTTSTSPRATGAAVGAYVPRTQEQKDAAKKKRAEHKEKKTADTAMRSTTMDIGGARSSTPEPTPPRRIQSLVSPRNNARRNFTIPKDALLKEQALVNQPERQDDTLNLQDIIAQLRKVQRSKTDSGTKDNAADLLLQDMLRRLRHVDELSLVDQRAELNDMLQQLQNVDSFGEQNLQQLQLMLDTLNSSMQEPKKDPNASRLEAVDHDWLESSLRRLQKIQLTPREAETVAETALKLRYIDLSDPNGESESNALIANHCDEVLVYPTRKLKEVTQVLQGLRRIDMNDKERKEYANKIRCIGIERPHVDELSQAILRLKKAGLNRWEAGHVGGIVADLRKTIKNLRAGNDEDDEESVDEYTRLTRKELRMLVDAPKMNIIDSVVDSLKETLVKVSDQEMNDFCKTVISMAKGDANSKQRQHQDYVDVLAEAIRNLKRARLNKWEAKEVSGVLTSLRKTPTIDRWDNGENRQMINLRKVTTPEQMGIIEDVVRKVKKVVRFSENDQIFEFFLDDIVATGECDPTNEQLQQYAALEMEAIDDDISYDDLKADGGDELASVDTMAISISSAEFTLGEEEVELTDSEDEEEKGPVTPSPKRRDANALSNPFPYRQNQLINRGSVSCPSSPAFGDPDQRKIVFTRKHHWKHKQHNTTVVGEKRWRMCEDFNTDEVIFSPLSKDQHTRRKAVESSLKKSLLALDIGGSSRSLGNCEDESKAGISLAIGTAMDLVEDETHVDVVERRLRENNITFNAVLKRGESAKRGVCLTPSPKRSMSGRSLVMTDQPELPF
ncbi:hypothetical protein IV203_023900 [Nitzschia inconspicua]|uniref:Uncharacterized protein n=1 Tax=Nitzschia inconspicua TaxID=303405 RepID=A0A9K3KB83_9STRA|nr:hypothetical protein IV203_023900 [Nitzschia inconspicua]